MQQIPKISVIIPVYNVEKYLRQCLDSVIKQSLPDIEIICIDDGSTDNSLQICNEYAINDSRINVIHQKNSGLGCARNSGLKNANGEYILFVDSDDWIEENACLEMYNKAVEINADIVLTGETLYYQSADKYGPGWRNFAGYKDMEEITESIVWETFTPACTRLYKKEFLDRNNLKFVENCFYEDNSWGCLMFILAKRIGFVKNQYYYRQRNDSITAVKDEKVFDWIKDYKYFYEFLTNNKIQSHKKLWADIWYFLNFHRYYWLLKSSNRNIFAEKIKEILPLMDINNEAIKNTKIIKDNHIIKELLLFLKYLKSNFFYRCWYKSKKLPQNICRWTFSIRNNPAKTHKIVTIWGIKIKFQRKKNLVFNQGSNNE